MTLEKIGVPFVEKTFYRIHPKTGKRQEQTVDTPAQAVKLRWEGWKEADSVLSADQVKKVQEFADAVDEHVDRPRKKAAKKQAPSAVETTSTELDVPESVPVLKAPDVSNTQ